MQNESRSREGIGVRELFRRTLAHRGQWALLLALGYLLFGFPWSWEGFRAFPVYLPIAAALLLGFLSAAVWEAAAGLITTPEDVRRITGVQVFVIPRMKYAEAPLPHLLDLVQEALRDESRIHHVVGPAAGTGKSLVAAALAEHAGRQGFAARLLNVDVKRRIPPAYEALLRTPSVHFSVEGPLEPAAAEKRVAEVREDTSGRFVFDHGPWRSMGSARLPESGRSVVVVGPRCVPMRALRAFVKRLRVTPAEVRWVFNEQPVPWNEAVFYPEP